MEKSLQRMMLIIDRSIAEIRLKKNLELKTEQINIAKLIDKIILSMESQAHKKGIKVY